MVSWMLRSRRTGRLTVAQLPNAPLAMFLLATAVRMLASPVGGWRTALDVVGNVALVVWAGDEMLRGVNPFRRMLGAVVLAVVLVGALR